MVFAQKRFAIFISYSPQENWGGKVWERHDPKIKYVMILNNWWCVWKKSLEMNSGDFLLEWHWISRKKMPSQHITWLYLHNDKYANSLYERSKDNCGKLMEKKRFTYRLSKREQEETGDCITHHEKSVETSKSMHWEVNTQIYLQRCRVTTRRTKNRAI